jgi:hypothetical protein
LMRKVVTGFAYMRNPLFFKWKAANEKQHQQP